MLRRQIPSLSCWSAKYTEADVTAGCTADNGPTQKNSKIKKHALKQFFIMPPASSSHLDDDAQPVPLPFPRVKPNVIASNATTIALERQLSIAKNENKGMDSDFVSKDDF
ncbi:MAG TPA: hypothetical protein PKY10_06340 [Lentisphaeria bacterium]|nr:hypothetical protein [Lentisphaeria bacterium]